MFNEYQDVLTNDNCHVGKTSRETFKIKPQRETISPPLHVKLKKTIEWLHDEVIEPLVPVTKESGAVRWCVDFCTVKKFMVTNSYPTPWISDILDLHSSSKIFLNLDAGNMYNIISVE